MALIRVPQPGIPGGMEVTPEQVASQLKFGQGLREQASSMAPRAGTPWLQALAAGLQGGMGGYGEYSAGQRKLEEQQRATAMFNNLLQSGTTPTLAQLAQASGNEWLNPMQGALLGEIAKSQLTHKDKWAVNPKTGRYYNVETAEEKAGPPGQPGPQDMNDFRNFMETAQKGPGWTRWMQVQPILESMERSLKSNTKITDLDFANGISKILDPTTGVLGGEQANVMAQAQSMGEMLGGKFLAALRGEGQLGPEERAAMYELARNRAMGFHSQAQAEREYWMRQGMTQFGMTPDMFPQLPGMSPWENPYAPRPQPPTTGTGASGGGSGGTGSGAGGSGY